VLIFVFMFVRLVFACLNNYKSTLPCFI